MSHDHRTKPMHLSQRLELCGDLRGKVESLLHGYEMPVVLTVLTELYIDCLKGIDMPLEEAVSILSEAWNK